MGALDELVRYFAATTGQELVIATAAERLAVDVILEAADSRVVGRRDHVDIHSAPRGLSLA